MLFMTVVSLQGTEMVAWKFCSNFMMSMI